MILSSYSGWWSMAGDQSLLCQMWQLTHQAPLRQWLWCCSGDWQGGFLVSENSAGVGELAERKQCSFHQEYVGEWRKDDARPLVRVSTLFLLMLWHCRLGDMKDIWSVKTTCATYPHRFPSWTNEERKLQEEPANQGSPGK